MSCVIARPAAAKTKASTLNRRNEKPLRLAEDCCYSDFSGKARQGETRSAPSRPLFPCPCKKRRCNPINTPHCSPLMFLFTFAYYLTSGAVQTFLRSQECLLFAVIFRVPSRYTTARAVITRQSAVGKLFPRQQRPQCSGPARPNVPADWRTCRAARWRLH